MAYRIDAKTPKGQAGQLLRFIDRMAGVQGAATLERRTYRNSNYAMRVSWKVIWEGGPFEWAIVGGAGGNIWGEELGYKLYDPRLPRTFQFADHVRFDHDSYHDIIFYPTLF